MSKDYHIGWITNCPLCGGEHGTELGMCPESKQAKIDKKKYEEALKKAEELDELPKSSGIQVEIPRWWVAQDVDLDWRVHFQEPKLLKGYWVGSAICRPSIKVTGFTGNFQDSLHQWNGKEWVKCSS